MIISDINGLTKWSKKLITVRCDSCDLEKEIMYKLYTSYGYSDGEYLCRSCKLKKNNNDKWGVDNVFQLKSVKDKTKKTNLEKWGVEYITQSDKIKVKVKDTISKLDKSEINEKRKKTNLEKWGVDNVSKSNETKQKKKQTFLINWGETNNKKSESFRKINFKVANHQNYINYVSDGISLFKCDNGKDHNFEASIDVFQKRVKYKTCICTICNPIDKHQSGLEINLFNYVKSIYDGVILQNFKIDKKEVDIYIPELKIGFEFNGVYWHSDIYKDKWFHLNKTNLFKESGIRVIHIWEDDWIYKNDILKSQIKNWLGKSDKKISARKCVVKELDSKICNNFLDENHIQGKTGSKIKLGLYYESELLSVMVFDDLEGRKRMGEDEWNLSRFCNKLDYTVIGGASKLLSYFIKNYNPKRIISYADKDWSSGNLYQNLGFNKVSESNPDYKYVINGVRSHKSNWKKSKTGVSESGLTIPRIWDCGKTKWELIKSFS